MGLQEELEEQRKAVAEAMEREGSPVVEEEEIVSQDPEEEGEVKENLEDAQEEPEIKTEPEEKPEETAFARLRRENAAMKKRLEALEATPKNPETQAEETGETALPVQEIQELLEERQYAKAGQEFTALEEEFRRKTENYDDIANQYKAALYNANKLKSPRSSHMELLNLTNKELLIKAGNYLREGLNPIEEMYEEAKELGFKPQPKEEEGREEKVKKPDLDKIAANKARNAGMVAAKGRGSEPRITRQTATEMTTAEWMKVPMAERERIMRGENG